MPVELLKEWIRKVEGDDITGIDQSRYPSDFANKDDAQLALKSSKIIRKFIREKFGLSAQQHVK